LLFPDDLREYAGYEDYFLSRRRWFFGIFALTFVVDIFDTWLKGIDYLETFGPEYFIRSGVDIVLCGLAMVLRSRIFHLAFVGIGWSTSRRGFSGCMTHCEGRELNSLAAPRRHLRAYSKCTFIDVRGAGVYYLNTSADGR
jgi:hypothetical protein